MCNVSPRILYSNELEKGHINKYICRPYITAAEQHKHVQMSTHTHTHTRTHARTHAHAACNTFVGEDMRITSHCSPTACSYITKHLNNIIGIYSQALYSRYTCTCTHTRYIQDIHTNYFILSKDSALQEVCVSRRLSIKEKKTCLTLS